MISRDIDVQYLKLKKEIGETIFTAKDFTDKRRRFENINFQIRSGEIVALAGLNGPAKRVWPRVFIG
ncbi:MAG: D-xylose ABC transporter ATP-binding protein, partial [Bacteroidales bacterium]|nr:D-xylose ABC transporter ATP-binding protein [Bacteroidales bacterium]